MAFPTFAAWAAMYGKTYNGDEPQREAAYNANIEWILENNEDGTQGVGPFMDITREEFNNQYLTLQTEDSMPRQAYLGQLEYSGVELPTEVDWSTKGAVTPIKNQGQCGSCWAFSTTGSLEGRQFVANGKLVPLSEQQFVDCDGTDKACQGGLMDQAFDFAQKHSGGICTESSYPYTGAKQTCKTAAQPIGDKCTVGLDATTITGWTDVANNENALSEAVSQGPVSVAVDALLRFQLYTGGIVTGYCGGALDHGVLIVGYGVEGSTPYWKVKNSWAASWGEKGYIRIQKGKTGTGECGIRAKASFPVISSSVSV